MVFTSDPEGFEKEKVENRDVLCPIALDDGWKTKDGILWRTLRRDKVILDFADWQTPDAFERQFHKLFKGLKIFYPKPARSSAPG